MDPSFILSEEELAGLVQLELEALLEKYDYKISDLDLLGEPPIQEFITERDLMIEI